MGPEKAIGEAPGEVFLDSRVGNLEEAADVVGVVLDELLTQIEDVHCYSKAAAPKKARCGVRLNASRAWRLCQQTKLAPGPIGFVMVIDWHLWLKLLDPVVEGSIERDCVPVHPFLERLASRLVRW